MAEFNLNEKVFKTAENKTGLSSTQTLFHYYQEGGVITADYSGGSIVKGSILGKHLGQNKIKLQYHCITDKGELKAGESEGIVLMNDEGLLELHFNWIWLNGDGSGGKSKYLEVVK